MLPEWLDLVWFHDFLILLIPEAFSLFYFLKQWGFLPFARAGMGHPSKICMKTTRMKETSVERHGGERKDCSEKQQKETTLAALSFSHLCLQR